MHDADFRQSEKDWHSFVEKLTERLVEIDDTVPELPVKDIVCESAWHRTDILSNEVNYLDLQDLPRRQIPRRTALQGIPAEDGVPILPSYPSANVRRK